MLELFFVSAVEFIGFNGIFYACHRDLHDCIKRDGLPRLCAVETRTRHAYVVRSQVIFVSTEEEQRRSLSLE